MNEGVTNQPMDNDIRQHNLLKNGVESDIGDSEEEVEDDTVNDVDCGGTSSGIKQREISPNVKHPKPEDTRVHNRLKDKKKDTDRVSGQSNTERGDFDTSDGKCNKRTNKKSEVLEDGDGPRLRRTTRIEKSAHLVKGNALGRVEIKRSPVATDIFKWYILPILSLLAVVVFWTRGNPYPPVQKEFNLLQVFFQKMEKIQAGFPSQHPELWRRSRIHLKKHLNLTDPTEPVSLILTSGYGAEKTLGCLAQQITTAYSSTLNSSVLIIDGTSKSSQDSDQVKLDIDEVLKAAFDGGTQAAVIHRFEELPPASTLIFYRYCDHENSAFKKVFLAFTVMLQEEVFPPNVHLGMVEEAVHEYIKEKFVPSNQMAKFNHMDLDKLSGLWSRISHLILPVAAEHHIEQHGCQP